MPLENYKPQKPFLVGIDSDGCVFDTMELKHKECFIPAFIRHFSLQSVGKYAREVSEFVNLYSKSRGSNRFLALLEQLDWLRGRPEVIERGTSVPKLEGLRNWVEQAKTLGNPSLAEIADATGDPDLKRVLAWSEDVNDAITAMIRNIAPFPSVKKCLHRFDEAADMLVVSGTPIKALEYEWEENGVARYVRALYGQETGPKRETLSLASHYDANHALMIGDSPGDYKAAIANKCLFFPINPGNEDASWQRLHDEGIDRFLFGTFSGDYQKQLLEEFETFLPAEPEWNVVEG
ncbi:MAG: HAD family hydrolase [Lacipirellulaceae bacterium]